MGKYVDANVVTDQSHYERIHAAIDELNKAIGVRVDEVRLIAALFKLCLVLLGGVPNHWDKKSINQPKYYLLDHFRTLHYSQSAKQKSELIYQRFIFPLWTSKSNTEEAHLLLGTYHEHNRRKQHSKFVDWFRQTHPEDYVSLFA